MPGGQKFSIQLSPLSVGFPQRRPLFNKKTPVYKLPRGAIYRPPCVQLINNRFFAIHQVFALSIIRSYQACSFLFVASVSLAHKQGKLARDRAREYRKVRSELREVLSKASLVASPNGPLHIGYLRKSLWRPQIGRNHPKP